MPAVEQGAQPLNVDQQRIGPPTLAVGLTARCVAFAPGFGERFEQAPDAGLHAFGIMCALGGAGGIGRAPRLHDAALIAACSRSPASQRSP